MQQPEGLFHLTVQSEGGKDRKFKASLHGWLCYNSL